MSWRKAAVGVSARRSSVSLCCTSGWPTTVTFGKDVIRAPLSEYAPVAQYGDWRASVRAARAGDLPACRPGAALQNGGQRQFGFGTAEPGTHERREAVEKRHSQRPPFDDRRVADRERGASKGRITQAEHAEVVEQPAVAVLGQAGENLDPAHPHARIFHHLDQRVTEPLRELVERHHAVAADQRMRPHVTHARPDRREGIEEGAEHETRRETGAVSPEIEQAADPGL